MNMIMGQQEVVNEKGTCLLSKIFELKEKHENEISTKFSLADSNRTARNTHDPTEKMVNHMTRLCSSI